MAALAADGRFDYLVVESTGISEPMPVAATFSAAAGGLADVARLDTMARRIFLEHSVIRCRRPDANDVTHVPICCEPRCGNTRFMHAAYVRNFSTYLGRGD